MPLLAGLVLALLLRAPVLAATDAVELDHLALAARLVADGEYARAERVLGQVDPQEEGLDLASYHTLRARVAQERGRQDEAAQAYEAALAHGAGGSVRLRLAQVLIELGRHRQALDVLGKAGPDLDEAVATWLLRAHAQWKLGRMQAAMDTLDEAAARFPQEPGFRRRQVLYLIEAGLYREAAERGRQLLQGSGARAADYAALGTALRRAGAVREALALLEAGRLAHPQDAAIVKALAQAWLDHGAPLAAASLLAGQASLHPELYAEAAELFRRAGHPRRALILNARVPDPVRKLRQRVGLLLALGHYDALVGLERALHRAGLLEDQEIRYALAYAQYRAGAFAEAERHLVPISRPDLFRKATELRRLMQECVDRRWACSG